ncbi:MAG: alpha/beta fold hydrolase, partial [Actinobacteria bacterium]|nr:alpha/beta fold hydrolase [Actinomycetota bacterium]
MVFQLILPGVRRRRALLVLVCVAVVSAVAPAGADALRLRSCAGQVGWVCGTLRVPLDHAGRSSGSLGIAVAAQSRPGRVLVALSGGPGQSSVDDAASWSSTLAPADGRYRIVVLDQRGTGRSGALRCPSIQRLRGLDPVTPEVVASCVRGVGSRASFYRTLDSVEDIEALRVALGVRRIALAGISYGTWVAQEYARRHPTHVDRLILDSIVGPDTPDPFLLDSFARLPRVLREQCAAGRCRGVARDPVADLGAVAARLRRGPITGVRFDASAARRPARIATEEQLFALISGADLNPYMQARLPGVLAAAAQGDDAPLLRLIPVGNGSVIPTPALSFGLNVITGCLDTALPYALTSAFDGRSARVDAAIAAVDPARYVPWSAAAVRASGFVEDCLLFPRQTLAQPATRPLPNVPALLLGGRLDMRTPIENARAVHQKMPRSSLVTVAGTGHDALDSDATGCIAEALRRFVGGRQVGNPCRGRTNQELVRPRAPQT